MSDAECDILSLGVWTGDRTRWDVPAVALVAAAATVAFGTGGQCARKHTLLNGFSLN